ncbi:MAG: hypothetical protein AAF711_14430 [Planctomycetota bacterium]
MSEEINLRLSVNEAVVLDAFLSRFSDADQLTIQDRAEERVLWNLQCVLERVHNPNWPSLAEARDALRDEI